MPDPTPLLTPHLADPTPELDLREDAPVRLDLKTGVVLALALLSLGGTWAIVRMGVASAEAGVSDVRGMLTSHVVVDAVRVSDAEKRLSGHDLRLQALELTGTSLEKRFDRLEKQMAEDKKEVLDAINRRGGGK